MRSFYAYFFVVGFVFANTNFYAGVEVYFSPDDKPQERLIELIEKARSMSAAVYHLTNYKIANALKEAAARKVPIELILDRCSISKNTKLVDSLVNAGIKVHIFHPAMLDTGYMPLMHNKYALFDMGNKKLLWTGSFNWTNAANNLNQENVIISDDETVYKKYDEQFARLRERAGDKNYVAKTETKKPKSQDYTGFLLQPLLSYLRVIIRP